MAFVAVIPLAEILRDRLIPRLFDIDRLLSDLCSMETWGCGGWRVDLLQCVQWYCGP